MRRTMPAIVTLTVVAALATELTACSSVDSAEVRTNGIEASFVVSVDAAAGATDVVGSLRVGNLTFVDLDDGEKLTATSGDVSTQLKRRHAFGATDYRGRLNGVTTPGTEVVVGWTRTGDNASAPRSVVQLAEPVSLVAPAVNTAFSRSRDDIVVGLESKSTDQSTTLSWTGDCIEAGSVEVRRDQTSVRIARGTIQRATPQTQTPSAGQTPPTTCKAYLTVTRRRGGQVDPAFGGGTITAESSSVRQIMIRP